MLETIERLVCDRCGAVSTEALESESAREVAKGEGWICNDQEDCCPRCAAKANGTPRA